MNKKECLQVYKLLSQAFPTAYKFFGESDIRSFCETYCAYFGDLPVQIVGRAVKNSIAKMTFRPPTPAEVETQVDEIGTSARERLKTLTETEVAETDEDKEFVKQLCLTIGGAYPEDEPKAPVNDAEVVFLQETIRVIDLHFGRRTEANMDELLGGLKFIND